MATKTPTTLTPEGYNYNPAATQYDKTYGGKPGTIGVPPSVYQEISTANPWVAGAGSSVGSLVDSELKGILSPDVIANIQNQAAAWGASSGMPLSGIGVNSGLRNLGLTSLQMQQTGQQNYLNFLGAMAPLQTDPNLTASIAQWNANVNAAPNPKSAAEKLQELATGVTTPTKKAPVTPMYATDIFGLDLGHF